MRKLSLSILTIAVFGVSRVSAQEPRSDTEGIFLNFHGNRTSWDLSDDTEFGELERESGPGLGFEFGYGASQTVALLMSFDGARISSEAQDSYTLVHFGIGARVSLLGPESVFRPYGKVTFTARTVEVDLDQLAVSMFGAGITGGVGLMAFLSPGFAITGEGLFTWGEMTELTTGGVAIETDVGAISDRINVGLTWYPGR